MDISQVDINSLLILKSLLEEKHVSNTALRMNVSQSSVSRALQKMRTLFSDELLVRTHSGYELTPKASNIKQDINLVINSLEVLVNKQSFTPQTTTSTVRFFGLQPQINTLMPTVISEIRRQAPKMTISIDITAKRHFEALIAGDVHFVLSAHQPPSSDQNLYRMTVAKREFKLLMSREHLLAEQTLSADKLLHCCFGQISLQGEKTLSFEHKFIELGLVDKKNRLSVPVLLSHFSSAANIAATSDIIFHLPAAYADEACLDSRLITREVPSELRLEFTSVYLYWHKRFHDDAMCEWVRSIFKQYYVEDHTENLIIA
ncbi:LysR family transcriptional regulator [Vibrio anguillarum]|uniref:LysR family transcriptional regulator n=9 Tax=Vibrio anguillarum TaxID=55601 RepID=A0A289GG18_VIBAN|nr:MULTISPECIES: LysR family transcriptional regulator [Vibrio]ASW82373.1 LysR family transcriptional regulator [Vibrio anguillarum]AXN05213.1 LysR family transcriptional regulator [Vibrio anguillarum]AZS25810.1 LysR family transcriptional regulator [Vibrio anguillarum]MBF4310911.1 LysR family transcriptional regulator [Vibrio anguillarum]MBF4324573.1 LysR family transcriptional regulator [Vibrio anguillarum]